MIPKRDISEIRRSERRWQKDRQDRTLRKLAAEYRQLNYARVNADLVPLEKPYQRGWVRFFKLTERATRRPDVELLKELLTYVNNHEYCRKRQFLGWSSEAGKMVTIPHRPRRLDLGQIVKFQVPARLYGYFRQLGGNRFLSNQTLAWLCERRMGARFEVTCPHLFRTVVVPHIVTHQRKEIPEARRREEEIAAWMDANNGWNRHDRLTGHRVWKWECARERIQMREREKEMKCALIGFNDRCSLGVESSETEEGTINIVPFDFYRILCERAA